MPSFWHDYLYNPLLNFLFFLYSGPARGNLGVAIIELTILLRLALLPFTIITERNGYKYEKLNKEIEAIERDFKADPVRRQENIRALLKQNKVNYWPKVFVLGVQLLVLVLLYQVFIGGVRLTGQEVLYSWVQAPTEVNKIFLGFNLGHRYVLWAGIVAVTLFMMLYAQQKRRAHLVKRSDVMFLFFFPLFTLVILWILPMVKALFVLTSLLFSFIVTQVRSALFKVPPPGHE